MIIEVDRQIFSDSCISKAVYWFSELYLCERKSVDNIEIISIEPTEKVKCYHEGDTRKLFLQTLHDYKLREIVRAETKDINTILYLKAFADCDQLLEDEITEL